MLKSKIAMALAAAMVMAALYGCSSSSDSGLKSDASALQGTIDKVADVLGLDPGATEEAILAALGTADPGELAKVRAALPDIASDAGADAIAAAITALRDTTTAALDSEFTHQRAVVAGINEADDANRPGADVIAATDGIAVDYALKASVTGLKEADAGAPDAGMSVQAMLTATDETTKITDKAFVYSNRMAPGDMEWNKYYDEATRMSGGSNLPGMAAVSGVQGVNDEGMNATDDDIVTYKLTFASDVSGDSALFMAAALPPNDQQTYTYSEDPDGDDETDDDNRKFDGSFHGVMGEYECTSADCMAATNADSELITLTGTWTFTPAEVAEDAAAHMVMGVEADDTYVVFGYWLRQSFDDDDKETVGVNTFSDGDGAIQPSAMDAIACEGIAANSTCSATYTGKAGGKYVVKTVTPQAEVSTLYTGQFVANVTLNANFGGETIAGADQDEISGTINSFEDAADDMNRISHWTVKLGTAETNNTNANVGKTNDGMMDGTWTHAFHSRQAENTVTMAVSEENMPPGNVAGVFDAHWSDGHAIGAYGASKE